VRLQCRIDITSRCETGSTGREKHRKGQDGEGRAVVHDRGQKRISCHVMWLSAVQQEDLGMERERLEGSSLPCTIRVEQWTLLLKRVPPNVLWSYRIDGMTRRW
jgi:hypothetical protein